MESSKLNLMAALNIMRRLPPSRTAQNLSALSTLRPDLEDELYQKVDQPSEIEIDTKVNKEFLKCEYNRDGGSYRSPYTNEYYPLLEKAIYPSPPMRELEIKGQILFEEYLKLYYEHGIVSVYFMDKEEGGFGAFILIKKDSGKVKGVESGNWDSINVIDVKIDSKNNKASYKITTTVILDINVKNQHAGDVTLSGYMTKQKEESNLSIEGKPDEFHLSRIGRLVEDNESGLKQILENVYFGKTKQITFDTRFDDGQKQAFKDSEKVRIGFMNTVAKKQASQVNEFFNTN